MWAKLVSLPLSLPGVCVQVASKLVPSLRRVQVAVQTLEPTVSTTRHVLPPGAGVCVATDVGPAGALSETVQEPDAQLMVPVIRLRSAENVPV